MLGRMMLAVVCFMGVHFFQASFAHADPVARNVTTSAGVSYSGLTHGEIGLADHDRDGDLDFLLPNHNLELWKFMRNNGNGTFTEVLQGTFPLHDRHGCVAADFGSPSGSGLPDGRLDLYCAVGACQGTCTKAYPNELWLQTTGGGFVDRAASWGVDDPHGRGREPIAINYNGDSLPDLAVANESPSIFPTPNRLFVNLGGSFSEVIDTPFRREAASHCIAKLTNSGGLSDVLVCSNGPSGSDGVLTFKNVGGSFGSGPAVTAYKGLRARDIEVADLDGKNGPDLVFVTQLKLSIWLNAGKNTFPAESFRYALQEGRDVAVCDVDRDPARRPDIYVVQGLTAGQTEQRPDVMLLNDGSGMRYRAMPIPQVRSGEGDLATCVPNWRKTGWPAIFVTNGKFQTRGPNQLIAFAAN